MTADVAVGRTGAMSKQVSNANNALMVYIRGVPYALLEWVDYHIHNSTYR